MGNFSKKMVSLVSVATLAATTMGVSLVSAASEFLPYAETLASNDVISTQSTEAGYRLGDTVTRAELAKVTANLGGYTATDCAGNVYGDVTSSLGDLCGYIEALADAGVVTTANANFRPDAAITRAEMVKMLLGAVGETGSDVDAGYMDIGGLNDLAGFINRANELGCAATASYFRPMATASRGEAFKIAACIAYPEDVVTPPDTDTGSTSTGVVAGALSIALDGTAVAQYVPQNASSVKVGSVKLTAGSAAVTVSTLTINRSGLGDSAGLTIAVGQNGTSISESRAVNTATQDAVIRLNNPMVIAAGSSVTLDVLVSVTGSANSQHQFTLKAVGTTAGVAGLPVTLGLINTTSYTVSTVKVTSIDFGTVSSGKNDQSLGTVKVQAGAKDVTLSALTLSKTSGVDMTKALANVKVYKNAVAVGTATVTSDKIYVTGLALKITRNDTVTLELRGDVTYVGAGTATDDITLDVSESTDVSATEDLTGYATAAEVTATADLLDLSDLDIVLTKNTTKSVTVAPGTSNVVLFDANVASSASFDVTTFTLNTVGAATPTTDNTETGAYNDLTLTVNGVDYDLLSTAISAGVYTFAAAADKFRIDAGTPVNVKLTANLSNAAGTGTYSYKFDITKVKNVSTGNEVTLSKNVTGDNVVVSAPSLTAKAATIAAPSASKIYSNTSALEVGRFGLEAKAEEVTVREVTITNGASSSGVNDFTKLVSGTNVKLVNIADGSTASATVTMSGTTAIKLTGMSVKVAKDTTANFKVLVDTQGDLTTTFTGANNQLALTIAVVSASSASSSSITVASYTTTKTYTVSVVPPTVTLVKKSANVFLMTITNADADTGVTLSSITAQVRPVSNNNSSYAAMFCIREEGSSDKCNASGVVLPTSSTAGTATATTGVVPGSANVFTGLSIAISASSSVTREIFIDSNFVSPSDLQGEITGLNYGVSETYSVIAQ